MNNLTTGKGEKRVLLVYPHNFLQGGMGTNVRVMEIASIFRELGYRIDQFGYEKLTESSSFRDFEQQNKSGMIDTLYVFDYRQRKQPGRMVYRLSRLTQMIKGDFIWNWAPKGARVQFADIMKKKHYDAIVFFYSQLAYLLRDGAAASVKKIYFMEDCIFLQQHYSSTTRIEKLATVGRLMDSDLKLMDQFDNIFGISNDEVLFFQRILGNKVQFFPHIKKKSLDCMDTGAEFAQKKWDAVFLGFDNVYNVEGLQWFLQEVYPHLDKNLRILLGGSMTKAATGSYENIDVIPFVEDLDAMYRNVKVVLCPMLRGTGMKIKVVEALERSIPVVCTTRGVDGLPDKTMAGCCVSDDPREFARYLNRLAMDENYHHQMATRAADYYRNVFDREYYKEKLRKALGS